MNGPNDRFYNDIASAYHLIFADWDVAIARQQTVLSQLLAPPDTAGIVLDCACGIGTQAIGLAKAGYAVEAIDLSSGAVDRARKEAVDRGLEIQCRVDDMRLLKSCSIDKFGAVIAFDNALPHLDSDDEVQAALAAMRKRLRPQGKIFISLRDYGPLMELHPGVTEPSFFLDNGRQRIVHQVWDWQDERRYIMHLFITREMQDSQWDVSHFIARYRAITPHEVAAHAENVGFRKVKVLQERDTGYYQPIVVATR